MDHFGIGAAMMAMTMTYGAAARRSGRTTSLVESVKDGDRIVFAHRNEAQRVERLCLDRGVKVRCIVVEPTDVRRLVSDGTSQGRTIFDHGWVEEYYKLAIEQASKNIDSLERETSGFGSAHRETQHRALELSKWRA